MDGFHWMDEARARQDVQQQVGELAASHALDPRRLLVGGFSNGGRTALLLPLTGAIRASYVVSIGGALRDETISTLDWEAIRAVPMPRVLLLVGERDDPVKTRLTEQAAIFSEHGLAVDLQVIPNLGHSIPPDFVGRLVAWLGTL
jgi:predicted esterase